MLESALVQRLATPITEAQIAALRAHLREMRAAVRRTDVPGRTRLPGDFHAALAPMLGNEVLAERLGLRAPDLADALTPHRQPAVRNGSR